MTIHACATQIRDAVRDVSCEAIDTVRDVATPLSRNDIQSMIREPMELLDQACRFGHFFVYGSGAISVITMAISITALVFSGGSFVGFLVGGGYSVLSVASGLICHESYVLLDGARFIQDKVATCLQTETPRRSDIRSGLHEIASKISAVKNSLWLIGPVFGDLIDPLLNQIRGELTPALNLA